MGGGQNILSPPIFLNGGVRYPPPPPPPVPTPLMTNNNTLKVTLIFGFGNI